MAFQEQFDRTVRWYERFRELDAGRSHTMESDNYQDEIYAFFLNCYHVKDWIRRDPQVSAATKGLVEDYISNTPALALCADLCNALKHFTLTHNLRTGSHPQLGSRHYSMNLGGPQVTLGMRLTITNAGQAYDAFQIATDALSAWVAFLNNAGYPVKMPAASGVTEPPELTPTYAIGVSDARLLIGRRPKAMLRWAIAGFASAFTWLGNRIVKRNRP